LGPYIDALFSQDEITGKAQAAQVMQALQDHLTEACIGSISEIFEGNYPHRPVGCVAQAWSVAEILRVIKRYKLREDVKR